MGNGKRDGILLVVFVVLVIALVIFIMLMISGCNDGRDTSSTRCPGAELEKDATRWTERNATRRS